MAFTGQSFAFDGTSFDAFLKVLDYDLMSPPGEIQTVRVQGRDGAFDTPTRYSDYNLTVVALIVGTSFADAITNRDTLLKTIATRNAGQLVFDNLTGRYYPAKFSSASAIDRLNPKSFRILLTFSVSDPFTLSTTETTIDLGPTSGTGSPEALATPSILGSADSYGVWILKNDVASGGSKTITLKNETIPTTFTHTRNLNSGTDDWLRYTPKSQKIEYSTDGGANWNRAPEGWSGVMPFLKVGSVNNLKLTSTHPITVEIKYNAAFL